MKNLLLITTLIFFNFTAIAQTQTRREEIDREIRDLMQARDEMMRSLLDDSAFSDFDDRFNDLVKKFEQNSFGGLNNLNMGSVVGEYDWRETPTHQILALKVKQIKDKPLDIKIEKGFVRLKGDVEEVSETPAGKSKRVSKVHFERSFSIPEGVDQANPEFENIEGELLIKFKKLNRIKSSPEKNLKRVPMKGDTREPVGRDSDDPVI